MTTNEPAAARVRRPSQSTDAGHRDPRPRRSGRRLQLALGATLGLAAAALLGPSSSLANHEPKACTNNPQGQGKVCVTVSDNPDPVSTSLSEGAPTLVEHVARVTNESRDSTLALVRLNEALSQGTIQEVSTSKGRCSFTSQAVDCNLGQLKKGQGATVEVVVRAPTSEGIITNDATASFEQPNQEGWIRQVTYSETTTVSPNAGEGFVPKGSTGQVDTDPAAAQYENVTVPNASTDVLVKVQVLPPDLFCVLGQVTIEGGVQVCRDGGWFEVSVTEADTGKTYRNTIDPLVFHLSWDQSLTSQLQNESNMVAFYQASDQAPTQVIGEDGRERCPDLDPATEGCLRNIEQESHTAGGWSFDLVKPSNPRMR